VQEVLGGVLLAAQRGEADEVLGEGDLGLETVLDRGKDVARKRLVHASLSSVSSSESMASRLNGAIRSRRKGASGSMVSPNSRA
jgi:hypothetical protein